MTVPTDADLPIQVVRRDMAAVTGPPRGFRFRRQYLLVLLLPLMMLSRLTRRTAAADYDPLAELRIGRVSNALLEFALDAERLLIRTGMTLPFGGSLLVVARRPA